MTKTKKSKCATCDGLGLFPFCSRCMKAPRGVGYVIPELPDNSPHAGLPNYERKRREAIDKQREVTQERDMEQLKQNMLKCNQRSTGVEHLDMELFIRFGPRETWK